MRRSSSSFARKLLIGPAAFSVSRAMVRTSRFIGAPETFLLTATSGCALSRARHIHARAAAAGSRDPKSR